NGGRCGETNATADQLEQGNAKMKARLTISASAAGRLFGTSPTLPAADNRTGSATVPSTSTASTAMGKWACIEGSGTGVSTAASSGPAAGIGVANRQTRRELHRAP